MSKEDARKLLNFYCECDSIDLRTFEVLNNAVKHLIVE